MPAVPPLVRHAPSPQIHTNWTFNTSDDECVAVAAAAGTSLLVTVRRDAPIRLVVSLGLSRLTDRQRPAALHRTGGAWQVSARRTAAHRFAVTLGSDDTALSHVLVLLSGGMLEVGPPAQPIVSLVDQPFGCAGRKLVRLRAREDAIAQRDDKIG